MYKAIIFDLDGTITDSEPAVIRAFILTLRELGRDYTEEQLRFTVGIPTEESFRMLGFDDIDACVGVFCKYQDDIVRNTRIFDGMSETIAALKVPLGLVTSETREEMQPNFYDRGLAPYFAATVSADDTERRKPSPDPLLLCLKLMGFEAADALYIGDTVYDMRCAASAGVDFGLARWGANPAESFDRVTHMLQKPADILTLQLTMNN